MAWSCSDVAEHVDLSSKKGGGEKRKNSTEKKEPAWENIPNKITGFLKESSAMCWQFLG